MLAIRALISPMRVLNYGVCAGRSKVIVRHENHPLAVEATLLANLGPISWLLTVIRAINGVLFGVAGRIIYYACHFVYTELPMLLDLEVRQHASWVPWQTELGEPAAGADAWALVCVCVTRAQGVARCQRQLLLLLKCRKCEVAARMTCFPSWTGLSHCPASNEPARWLTTCAVQAKHAVLRDLLGAVGLRAGSGT